MCTAKECLEHEPRAYTVGLPKATWKVPELGQSGSTSCSLTSTRILDVPNAGQNTTGCRTLHSYPLWSRLHKTEWKLHKHSQ